MLVYWGLEEVPKQVCLAMWEEPMQREAVVDLGMRRKVRLEQALGAARRVVPLC